MPQINITPDQIPAFLADQRSQLSGVQEILTNKQNCLSLLDTMEGAVAENNLVGAFSAFIEINKIEYSAVIKSLQEKKNQLEGIIKQLESPLSIPTMKVPFPAPPRRS